MFSVNKNMNFILSVKYFFLNKSENVINNKSHHAVLLPKISVF